MQNGFFDDLLREEAAKRESVEEAESEAVVSDGVEASEDLKEEETIEFSFGNLAKEEPKEEAKVEEPKEEVKQEKKRSTPKKEAKVEDKETGEILNVPSEKVDLPKEEVKSQPTQNLASSTPNQLAKKDFTQTLIENTLNKINDITTFSNEVFTTRAKNCAMDIITSIDHALNEKGMKWGQVDAKGSNLIMQIKQWAKLGIDISNDKLYPDIRKNNKTNMYDIRVKGQYQTVEKLITNFFKRNVFRFKTEVICVGDEFKCDFDYATGEDKVISFVKNMKVDRNKLDNITGAFKILYYYDEDNKIHQIVTKIEKDRIMRAYNAAQTKNVWNMDTQKMVKKTVTWEMFNGEDIRPFMNYPEDIIQDLAVVNDNEDIDFNKEHKYSNVVEAQTHIEESMGTDEKVGFN